MLRNTVSRVKKACSVAFVPRILRGDVCGVPVSNAAVRKALESTKSTDDGNQYLLGSEDNVQKKSDEAANLDKTLTETNQPLLPPSIPLTHRERCQKIIDKAFGNCEHTTETDPDVGEQYFSHSVNLKEARRKILEAEERLKVEEELHIQNQNPVQHDTRTQYGIFNMPDNLDDHDEILHDVSISEVHTTARDPNLDKDVESYVKDPESLENKALCDDDAKTIEMGKDERRKYVYREAISQEQIQTLLPYSKTQFGVYSLPREDDPEKLTEPTMEIVVDSEDLDKTFATNANEDIESCVKNLEFVENKKQSERDVIKHMFINANTTAKDDENQLLQKLETIEETLLVEAPKPKLDGFNVTPKVLGDKCVLNRKSIENNQGNLHGNLDDMAKRCLNSPLGQIDEILLNEMEKHPCTRKTESRQLRDILVQMNELKEHPNTGGRHQAILSKCRKFKDEEEEKVRSEILYITGLLNSTRHYTALPDLNKQSKEDGQPARETVEIIKQKIDNESTLKNTKSNEAIVADMHVVTGVESMQESKGTASIVNNLSRDAQNLQCPSAEETEECFSKVASYKGVHRPSYETVNASNYAMHGRQQKAGRNSLYTRKSYNGPDMWGHKQQNASNKKCERVLLTNFYLPENKLNKQTEHLPKGDKAAPLCTPEKSYLTEPLQAYEKGSLSDELLKEHELDPGPEMWGHNRQNAFASETDYLIQKGETDRIECQSQTPQGQSTEEEGLVHKPNTANKNCEIVPSHDNLYFPEHKWNKQTEHLSKGHKATPLCTPEKSYLTEPRQEYQNGSLSDELLKEHELDPYYVLACNETCPIAPVSTCSTYKNSDFVDSTESLRMKKNNQQSRRHKSLPRDVLTEKNVPQDKKVRYKSDKEFQPEILPEPENRAIPNVIQNLPKLNDNVSLSELLRRVRQRNRLECIEDLKAMGITVSPTVGVGKCPRPAPRCPPTAPRSPPNNPVPPPTFGLPMLKARPPVCKPVKKKPVCKCIACETDVSCGVQIGEICPEMAYELSEAEVCALTSKSDCTKVIADRLQTLGIVLNRALRQVKSSAEMLFARDYDPWAPIPSWPIPTKAANPCDKKCIPTPRCNLGCPTGPKVRASMKTDPPCDLKPCEGFPKRTYSMLDYFAVSLGRTKVNDLGHF